jgi:hypothetical protein
MRRRPTLLLLVLAGPLLYLSRRHDGRRERVSLYYADGSMVTLDRRAPGVDRLLALARAAL